jgi:heme-degrading monooxygenase HmoA
METERNEIFTLGIWRVKPGKETEFISEWTAFARLSGKDFAGSGKAWLLQDENDPLKFISFGPWEDHAAIEKWRNSDDFRSFVMRVRELCEQFQPNTMKAVANSVGHSSLNIV